MARSDDDLSIPLIAGASKVPPECRPLFLEIVGLTDRFCKERLNEEYQQLCREMAIVLSQPGGPLVRGRRASWASGIAYTVGWVNFLTDPSQSPHMKSEDIAKSFGVSVGTMQSKSKVIRDELDLVPFHPTYCLPSRLEENPLAWMIELNGFIIDARSAPKEIQVTAFENGGLIPYLPGDDQESATRRAPK